MNRTEYEFIDYRPELKTQVLRLLTEMWGNDMELKSDHFDWKFLRNPYADKFRGKLALYNGQVVGVRNMFPMRWHIGQLNRDMLTLACSDAFVHTDHRRRGLLSTMTRSILEESVDSPYEYSTTLYPVIASAAAYQKLGWKSVGFPETGLRLRPPSPERHSRLRIFARNIPYLRSTYRRLRSKIAPSSSPSTEALTNFHVFDKSAVVHNSSSDAVISISQVPKAGAMAGLMKQIDNSMYIQHVRDEEYFNWRYQNPNATYRFIYSGSEMLDGYLVLRSRLGATDGLVNVVDWTATSMQTYERLLQTGISLGDFMAITIWAETLSVEVKQLLDDSGFQLSQDLEETDPSRKIPPRLLVRPIAIEERDTDWEIDGLNLLDINNWNIHMIDADGS